MKRLSLVLSLSALLGCGSDDNGGSAELTDDKSPSSTSDGGIKTRTDAGGKKSDAGKTSSSGGSSSGGGNSSGTNDGLCSSKTIPARVNPPDVLIVLDKSLSMLTGRWQPSVAAVNDFTARFQTTVSFGLSTFPGSANGACGAGALDVPLALNNADAITTYLGSTFPFGVTPTAPALRAAHDFLGDRTVTGDAVPTPAYVVLVTDGEPTCPYSDTPDPSAGAVNATQALSDAKIKTYTIGYNLDQIGKRLMDQLAMIGGTEHSYPVENPDELNAAFAAITKDVVRCEFELDEEPQDPTFVLITIDGKTVQLDPADGWVISGKTVTLVGGSCEVLKDGQPHALKASVECTQVYL